MTDKQALKWLKQNIGTLKGYRLGTRDDVYRLAIQALENQQAMKDIRKDISKPKTLTQ